MTIASHRERTNAVIHKTEANDQWSYYQAKRIRAEVLGVGMSLSTLVSPSSDARTSAARMQADRDRENQEADDLKKETQAKEAESARSEQRALRFDLGEGLPELGLVLTSLYFLSKKRSFPLFGLSAASLGLLAAVLGALY
ncbi:MAG TPA: DUF4337 family protein [Gammaproteobacteria bacterium]|nr:DUF4337 family protein [Gammaproteobacteria bacterium]